MAVVLCPFPLQFSVCRFLHSKSVTATVVIFLCFSATTTGRIASGFPILNDILLHEGNQKKDASLAPLISIIRQPLQVFKITESFDPSSAKTMLGVLGSWLLKETAETASDLAELRNTIGSGIRGGAVHALSASDAVANTLREAAGKAAHIESVVSQHAKIMVQPQQGDRSLPTLHGNLE